jgi:hypothetical protein
MTLHPGQIVSPREPHPAGELFIVKRLSAGGNGYTLLHAHPFPGGPFGLRVYLFHPDDVAPIPALSIWQPWAWLIVRGYKDVENRTWAPKTPPPWLLIHAGKKREFDESQADHEMLIRGITPKAMPDQKAGAQTGGIVGIVRLVEFTQLPYSPWAEQTHGTWHWLLKDARPLPFHPCKGQQGLFYPTYDLGLLQGARPCLT